YDTTHVPIGEDQKQHVELTRDIAQKFNHGYKTDAFVIPTPVMKKEGARIMSLKDASKKMSKSDNDDGGIIYLMDSDDEIVSKIKKAKTDSDPIPDNVEALDLRPEVKNLLTIYCSLTGISLSEATKKFAGFNFGTFKPILSETVIESVSPIRDKIKELMANKDYLEKILNDGADSARQKASAKTDEIKKIMGLTSF
ncbi:MAG: tryptophan--tRNA ligase, partial [Rickettsiales bacterium]|nr:tryptophan--tRNA ligase [Rickettsiales bacterium]